MYVSLHTVNSEISPWYVGGSKSNWFQIDTDHSADHYLNAVFSNKEWNNRLLIVARF